MKKSLSGFVMAFCLATLLQAQPVLAASDRGGSEGGGNVYKGKLVDMMADEDITRLKDYQKYVVPVIQDLKAKVPEFGEEFERTLKSLTWYFMRGELPKVSTEVNGIPMETDRAAVPIGDEIWVDMNKVDESKKKYKNPRILGEVLVHETALYLAKGENKKRHAATRKFVPLVFKSNPPATEEELSSAIYHLSADLPYTTATDIRKEEEDLRKQAEEVQALKKKTALMVLKGCKAVDDARQKAADPSFQDFGSLVIDTYFEMNYAYIDAYIAAESAYEWDFDREVRRVGSDLNSEFRSAHHDLKQRWERLHSLGFTQELARKSLLEGELEGLHCKRFKEEYGKDPSLQDAAQAAADATRALASLSPSSGDAKVASNTSKPGTALVIDMASPEAQRQSGSASRAY